MMVNNSLSAGCGEATARPRDDLARLRRGVTIRRQAEKLIESDSIKSDLTNKNAERQSKYSIF